ncbi:Ribonuclease PH [Crocosphaera watsonii WH 0003]|nr:Ribonuclease PH [Crocosphaera watsonii WH 0003]
MLPGSTQERQRREFLKLSGRTQEIQRLIGRSLRSCINLQQLGERTITIDCDVLQADGGTRTTSITGGYVALGLAIKKLLKTGDLTTSPLKFPVAAISVGLIEGDAFLDLNYPEDFKADIDFNVVMTENLDLIEVQGTAEENSFTRSQLNQMLDLAEIGIKELVSRQNQILSTTDN